MPSLVILGASGFIGRDLLSIGRFPMGVKAVSSKVPLPGAALERNGVAWFGADLLVSTALDAVLDQHDVVLNLAFSSAANQESSQALLGNVIEACIRARASRLIHCSTAAVAGAAKPSRIFESTACVPVTAYERTKLALEFQVLEAVSRGLDVGILRPTTIVGQGGANLMKLAHSLRYSGTVLNYLRASCFGNRAMHLVSVRNVSAALLHLAMMEPSLQGNIYHVSSDDDPDNNFEAVESTLCRVMGLRTRRLLPVPVPAWALSVLLRLRGRSDTNPHRVYDNCKLCETNFQPVESVSDAIRNFGIGLRAGRGDCVGDF